MFDSLVGCDTDDNGKTFPNFRGSLLTPKSEAVCDDGFDGEAKTDPAAYLFQMATPAGKVSTNSLWVKNKMLKISASVSLVHQPFELLKFRQMAQFCIYVLLDFHTKHAQIIKAAIQWENCILQVTYERNSILGLLKYKGTQI